MLKNAKRPKDVAIANNVKTTDCYAEKNLTKETLLEQRKKVHVKILQNCTFPCTAI